MVTLQIDEKETVLLKELVSKYLVDLEREISRTEKKAFREGLEEEKALMKKLLEQLPK